LEDFEFANQVAESVLFNRVLLVPVELLPLFSVIYCFIGGGPALPADALPSGDRDRDGAPLLLAFFIFFNVYYLITIIKYDN